MVLPDDLDLSLSDEQLVDELVAGGYYERPAAEFVVDVLRGRVDFPVR